MTDRVWLAPFNDRVYLHGRHRGARRMIAHREWRAC
jgi:hypothetical protein